MDLAPSRASRMMSACPACWAVSATMCRNPRRAERVAPGANHGAGRIEAEGADLDRGLSHNGDHDRLAAARFARQEVEARVKVAAQALDLAGSGIGRCAACGNELFASDKKYDSGSGWPSFTSGMHCGLLR